MKLPRAAFLLFLGLAATSGPAGAGPTEWFLAHRADWEFVQGTGGIRILKPKQVIGRVLLPVLYDASGSSAITCKPTIVDTGLVVDQIKVRREHSSLVIKILTLPLKDTGSTEGTGRLHYADLTGFPPGVYDVYYARIGDPQTLLGQIRLDSGSG